MARARSIKPSFFSNEELAELSAGTRLLFIGLWTIADRNGRLEDRPKRIKAELFPYDNIDLEEGLSKLHKSGFIDRYSVNDTKVILINNFVKHQNCHPSEKASNLPDRLKPAENCEAVISHDKEIISHGDAVKNQNEKCLLPITYYPLPSTSNPITSNPIIDSLSPLAEIKKTEKNPIPLVFERKGTEFRLNKKDYDDWLGLYKITGGTENQFWEWLSSRFDWYEKQPPHIRKKWFISTKTFLEKMANDIHAEKQEINEA